MEAYKSILSRELQQHGWDIHSVDPDGVGWWTDKHWTNASTRQTWGMTLVVSFLVDLSRNVGDFVNSSYEYSHRKCSQL